jgi:hypothetical protein
MAIDIIVPEEKILKEADGDTSAALRLAATFGYELAFRDLDEVALPTIKKEAK